jgi:hypothetical protein
MNPTNLMEFKKEEIIMYLCANYHEEICYEGSSCPACDLLQTISDLEDEIYDLKEEIEKLNNTEGLRHGNRISV